MAQSRATGKGQRKGKNVPIGDALFLPISSGSASVPSLASGAATTTSNVEGRQQPHDNKYPLWKYVTREQGPGSKMKGGGNVAWKCIYCENHFMSTYYNVKAHLLALPSCGIATCTQGSLAKRKEMDKEANVDPARHPLINFMVSSLNGPVFLKLVDALGQYNDAQYMGELFIKVIEDVVVDSCVQIITDNVLVCKAAGMIVEAKYPQVFWTPCIVHSLNLAFKSIAYDVLWIGSIIEDARHIRNFVKNHTNALTIYKEYTNLSLLKIAVTRFASSFIMLKRLREVKNALGAMVISKFWSFWRKTDQAASKRVKDTMLDDAWWERSECLEYETSSKAFFTTIHDILVNKWDKNPKYYNHEWLNGGPSRRFPPHMDGEISQGRKDALRWIFQDRASLDEVEDAFVEFSIGTSQFVGYDVIRDRVAKKPYSWWSTHGATSPPL
eukprot:PITA_18206